MLFPKILLPGVLSSHLAIAASNQPVSRHSHGQDTLGAVSSESDICSQIGVDVVKAGGNAADSLIATTFCVGVVGMYHSGIAGGGFMVVRSSNGSYEFIDFRETAPAKAFQDMFINNTNSSIYTGLASGVPGELRGLERLHQAYASMSWKSLVWPAVRVARNGFPVTLDLVEHMSSAIEGIDNFLVNDPAWAIDFAPNGTLLGLGDIMTRRRYADTLESIAKRGPNAFYTGPIAEATIKTITTTGGIMTLQDLRDYTVATRKPAKITYRGYRLHSGSAPSSGTAALSALKIIEGYSDIGHPDVLNLSTHRLDEALRFAYGQRADLGDPFFVEGMDKYQDDILSDATTSAVRAKIDDLATQNVSAYDPNGLESLETPGTSAVVAADANGLAIALTTTINLLFGSHVIVPETGVILNNEMNDFSIPGASNAFGFIPSPANFIRPGKRPLSSISPTIVECADGKLYFVVASAGGSRIITAVVQNLWSVLDRNMTAPEALAAPRLHDQLVPNQVSVEYDYNNATVDFLRQRGHHVKWTAPGGSIAQSLRILRNGTFEAAGEPRQSNSGGYAI